MEEHPALWGERGSVSHSLQRLLFLFLHIHMALSVSSCRFTQGVGHLRNKYSSSLQETAISTQSAHQQVDEGPQGSSYLSQTSRTSGTGSGSIPGFIASPEVPLSFPSHMRSRNTQNNLVMTQLNNRTAAGNKVSSVKDRKKSNRKSKSTYKHVPHREKPAHVVARRNARERRRVQVKKQCLSDVCYIFLVFSLIEC